MLLLITVVRKDAKEIEETIVVFVTLSLVAFQFGVGLAPLPPGYAYMVQ